MEYVRRTGQRTPALEDLSTRIASQEFVSIVGPSGCGKTTFLNMVSGLLEPTSGVITVCGQPSTSNRIKRSMVFQDASLFPWYTVERNIAYGLECRQVSRKAARAEVQPLIELVGLHRFRKHYPHELSGGMQQRVNLARALAVEPDILLMDEPFAALDAQTREVMQGELLKIWERTKKTVLFVTHQIDEALYLSDRVIVMSARPGRILADIEVGIPRPRALAVKREPRFTALMQAVWSLLEDEVKRVMADEGNDSAD